MEFIYVLVQNYNSEWDDTIIYTDEKEAIEQSILRPECRVEIFSKNIKGGYKPTYNYYRNGKLIMNN